MTTLPTISEDKTQQELSAKLAHIRRNALIEGKKQEARAFGLNFITLKKRAIPSSVLALIPSPEAQRHQVIAYYKDNELIKLACVDPQNPNVRQITDMLSKKFNRPVELAVTMEDDLAEVLKQYQYLRIAQPGAIMNIDEAAIKTFATEIVDYREIADKIHQVSLSEFLNLLFAAALKIKASDIHFQPEAEIVKVRFRIDGVMHRVFDLELEKFSGIKKRIKLIAKLKINIEDKPQDGSFSINLPGNKIDMRVSCLPSQYGESIVIRLLNPKSVEMAFPKLGFRAEVLALLEQEIKKPNGMIITCGPTGSGKTTTLYTILQELNTDENKIITLENPIEYKLAGITQTQVNRKDFNFAEGLKAILRQDPDIIMIGEIRDLETADVAINAALTGHLVISTIHTNDATGAIPRFVAMGVKPFLLAPSLNLIIGQRLVRRLCRQCQVPFKINKDLLERVKKELAVLPAEVLKDVDLANLTFYAGHSCNYCNGLGYQGRIGIYELLKMNEQVATAIQKGEVAEYQIAELARAQGMITMVQDGLLKALAGITTVEEVFRVAD